ncbi:MAG: DUF6639 family protein [Pseudomonadota bacterium]
MNSICFAPALMSGAMLAIGGLAAQAAEHFACAGIPVTIRAESGTPVTVACDAAGAAIAFLSRCGIGPKHGLTIQTVDEILHPCGTRTLGQFVPSQRRIEITSLARCGEELGPDSPYRRLPLIEVWRSLIAHEVAHGILHDQPDAGRLPVNAHEYVAYAVQIGTMSAGSRATFLDAFPNAEGAELASFTAFAHDVEPLRFGARAYRHFTAPDHGCSLLERMIGGEVTFPAPDSTPP